MPKKIKLIILTLLVVLMALLVTALVDSSKHRGLIKVDVNTLPKGAAITIDNRPGGTTEYLKPGTYTFSATKKGFSPDTQKVEISSSSHSVYLIPGPVSDEAKKYRADPKVQIQVEDYTGRIMSTKGASMIQKYPLTNKLPYIDRYFRIDYGAGVRSKDTVTPTAIYIRASSPENRQMALSWIRQQGFDPTDYEIIFKNATNPFVGQQ